MNYNLEALLSLEDKLETQVGKKLRYDNLVWERYTSLGQTATTEQKIAIAEEVLDGAWLGTLGAQAELVKKQSRKFTG
jgi:hypothetical protein